MNKKSWLILTIILAVAVLLQFATFQQYSRLRTSVNRFVVGMQTAKTPKQAEAIGMKFIQENKAIFATTQSQAGFWGSFWGALRSVFVGVEAPHGFDGVGVPGNNYVPLNNNDITPEQ